MRRTRSTILTIALLAVASTAFAAAVAHDVSGRWSLAVVTENGTGYPTLVLKQEGEKLTGTYESNAMGLRTVDGTVKGDSLRFVLSAAAGGESVVLTYMARIVTEDSLHGLVDFAGMGSATFTGKRQR